MKIIITGIKGFIGYQLYLKLKETNHTIIGIDNCSGKATDEREVESFILNNFDEVEKIDDVDVLIHLAAKAGVRESFKFPQLYYENNVIRSEKVFKKYSDVRKIIYASSSSVKEILNPYAESKRDMEKIAPDHAIGLRFHTVYGPLGRPDMLIRMLKENRCDYITNHTRDFTHVYDIVDAIITCMENDVPAGAYDVGYGTSIPVKKVAELMDKDLPIKEVENEMETTLSDCTELKKYGWEPKIHIEEGLKEI